MGNICCIFFKNDDIITKCPIKIDTLLYEYPNEYLNEIPIGIPLLTKENNYYNQLYNNRVSVNDEFLDGIILSELLDKTIANINTLLFSAISCLCFNKNIIKKYATNDIKAE